MRIQTNSEIRDDETSRRRRNLERRASYRADIRRADIFNDLFGICVHQRHDTVSIFSSGRYPFLSRPRGSRVT